MPSVSPVQAPVVARPKTDLYAVSGVLAFIGLILVGAGLYAWHGSPRRAPQDLWIGLAATAILFLLPCACCLWLMRRLRLVADARGLRICGVFKTRFIAWQNIEDYELRPPETYGQQTRQTWICANGKWRRLPILHDDMDALRARIQTQATRSRTRGWQLNIARDDADAWPKIYAYRDPAGARQFALVALGLLLCVALIGSLGSSSATANLSRDALLGWLQLAALLLPLLWIHYAIMRAKKRAGARTIRADQNALTIVDNEVSTRIAWDEIADYFVEDPKKGVSLPQYVVEGAGGRVVFRADIANFGELRALIAARAVNAISREWRHRENADKDTLGGAPSLWPGAPDIGRKVYHYRTRTLRALLVLGGAMLLILPIRILGLIPLSDGQTPTLPDRMIGLIFVAPVVALVLGGALAFWRASIQTDENGLLHRSIWGERFLRWSEVESFSFNGHFYQIKGARTTIRYWLVAASDNLRAEIEARSGLEMRRNGRSQSDE